MKYERNVVFMIHFYQFSQEYSLLEEREGHSPVSRWELNWLRKRGGLATYRVD